MTDAREKEIHALYEKTSLVLIRSALEDLFAEIRSLRELVSRLEKREPEQR